MYPKSFTMIVLKLKKGTEKELPHTDVYFDGEYIGYIIKSLKTEPDGWVFVNKSEHPLYRLENEVYKVLRQKTKTKLIDEIKEILYHNK